MHEVNNILRILEETKKAIKNGDSSAVNILSNQTINTASLTQDPDNIAVAVIVYSLSKILDKPNYQNFPGWRDFYKNYINSIDRAIGAIKKNNPKEIKESLNNIRKNINKLPGDLKRNIQEVFRKASINKASRIYEHGISMERTADLLGLTMFDLASYAGSQAGGVADISENKTLSVRERIKLAEEIFS